EDFVVALPAAAAVLQPDLVQVDLAGDLEEPLRGAEPDGPGRGVDGLEGDVEELLVELGRRQVGPGEFGRALERLFDLAAVPGPLLGAGGRGGGRAHVSPRSAGSVRSLNPELA